VQQRFIRLWRIPLVEDAVCGAGLRGKLPFIKNSTATILKSSHFEAATFKEMKRVEKC
jgi:hypothetical protein